MEFEEVVPSSHQLTRAQATSQWSLTISRAPVRGGKSVTLSPGAADDNGSASDSDLEPDELDYHRHMFEIMIYSFYSQYTNKMNSINSTDLGNKK